MLLDQRDNFSKIIDWESYFTGEIGLGVQFFNNLQENKRICSMFNLFIQIKLEERAHVT